MNLLKVTLMGLYRSEIAPIIKEDLLDHLLKTSYNIDHDGDCPDKITVHDPKGNFVLTRLGPTNMFELQIIDYEPDMLFP